MQMQPLAISNLKKKQPEKQANQHTYSMCTSHSEFPEQVTGDTIYLENETQTSIC